MEVIISIAVVFYLPPLVDIVRTKIARHRRLYCA